MKLDLHIHSIYSDGSLSPEELVDTAIDLDISAISITDHDNILSYKHALSQAELRSKETEKEVIEIIPGVEINTLWKDYEVHILGYYMDLTSKPFLDLLAYQQHARADQTQKIVKKLNKEGINIKLEDISSLVIEGGSIGRPHIARAITNVGGARNIIDAYTKYINNNSPTYVKRKTVSPHEAVESIYEACGIPVIAHPGDIEIMDDLVKELISFGLRGIEAYHRKHSPAMVEYYFSMAEKYGLIVTGGSDYHGSAGNKKLVPGQNFVPGWVLGKLKEEKNRIEIASY
ncbi:MAG: hypothetical protein A2104_01860 [Candidatus Melainabacteria bacterium GWF2_32_7]|nr:MAG: hypothetical protein A2104_01860 [Candidatus Melainabacteria bacterium GWF2_32_7]OGI23281.1 MAG: hypothetical protein A2255_06180 [Candidatus Melainabacteria bacterium RIFOXYA2_FULL_32_9]